MKSLNGKDILTNHELLTYQFNIDMVCINECKVNKYFS